MGYDTKRNGERLRILRAGKSRHEVAKDLGISYVLYGMYEQGVRNPSDSNKLKIARYFGVPLFDIFFEERSTDSN